MEAVQNPFDATTASSPWTDRKRHLWLLSPLVPLYGLVVIGLFQYTGWTVFAWGGWILLYGIVAPLDWLIRDDTKNPPDDAIARMEADLYYRIIVYAYIPTQVLLTIWGTWVVVTMHPAWYDVLGLLLTVGLVNGIAINTAHELGHKTNAFERWLSKVSLAPVAYGHFFVEHNRGHHVNVATPSDPASSRMGETFWAFLPRTMIGSAKSAWRIEKQRLARNGKSTWSIHNEILQGFSMTVVLFGALIIWLGWIALPFLILQAFYGASLLEVVNYMEHYGLLRHKDANGRVERCRPEHSWNSNQIVSNLFLYQLERHSDHHANPTRRFSSLRHFEESPQLPSGYAGMIWAAYIPWVWFGMMDHRVAEHYRGDLTRANLQPSRRERLMARWHDPARYAGSTGARADVSPAAAAVVDSDECDYRCPNCGYVYVESVGCEYQGFPPGTPWTELPDNWPCPDCAVREKLDFVPVAGEAQTES